MSLHPTDSTSIPKETIRVARSAFPKGMLAMQLRDTLGSVFADPMFVGYGNDYYFLGPFRRDEKKLLTLRQSAREI